MLHLFILHTSASLTVNENADPDVRTDMETVFNHLAPERGLPLVHTIEGPDDMPAHVKASLLGASTSVPITGVQAYTWDLARNLPLRTSQSWWSTALGRDHYGE